MIVSRMEMSRSDLMSCIGSRKQEIVRKLENGETQESVVMGGSSFTQTQWDRLIDKIDENIEAVKEEQEKKQEDSMQELYEVQSSKSFYFLDRMNGESSKVPYGHLAENGVITYNGVTFVCDEEKSAICLGDMSNKKNVLTIPLSDGGNLMVNRDNLGDLADAISMFSPEDINRIMRAIADDNKAQEMQKEIEEETNSLGDSADAAV